MGKEQCHQDKEKECCASRRCYIEEPGTRKIKGNAKEKTKRNQDRKHTGENEEFQLNNPLTWTINNIDKVAEAVKLNPKEEYTSIFWNTYKGSFSDIPCNEPLREIILKAKKSHSTYHTISDEEYLGDVMALMGMKMLADWNAEKESLSRYICCRCRPNAEYGRSILKNHGNKVYSLAKNDENGSFHICKINQYNRKKYPDYAGKYFNQSSISIDAIVQEEKHGKFYALYAVHENGIYQVEANSLRTWLMDVCHVTEYEMQICEVIADSGKKVNAKTVQGINETIVIPAGNPPMTQKEVAALRHRVHIRAKRYYREVMKGLC